MTARAALLLAVLLAAAGCGPAPVHGPYGRYPERPHELRLEGDTLVVYRVRHWSHAGAAGEALQLEYAPELPVTDTVALRALARYLWPSFAPYVEAANVDRAVITATELKIRGIYVYRRASLRHFGVIAERDSSNTWRIWGESVPLPPAADGEPRIFRASGRAVSFEEASPSAAASVP